MPNDRTRFASLLELIAADTVQEVQVLLNSLTVDSLFAEYLSAGEIFGGELDTGATQDDSSVDSHFAELREELKDLLSSSTSLLHRAGQSSIVNFCEEHSSNTEQLALVMKRVGIMHDRVMGLASMASPDMTRAWRRLELTDRHAENVGIACARLAATAFWKLARASTPLPTVAIDYRHCYYYRSVGPIGGSSIYLEIPFFAVYIPRLGIGNVVHECAHYAAEIFMAVDTESSPGSADIRKGVLDVGALIAVFLDGGDDDKTHSVSEHQLRDSLNRARAIVVEVVADLCAMAILGPGYIVNVADSLIGTIRFRQKNEPLLINRVPHWIRLKLLLEVYESGRFGTAEQEPRIFLDEISELLDGYLQESAELGGDRSAWCRLQINIVTVMLPRLEELIEGWFSPHHDGTCAFDAVDELRDTGGFAVYTKLWHDAGAAAGRDNATPVSSRGESLLGDLQRLPELVEFTRSVPDADPAPGISVLPGEVWSLDWFWLRAKPPRNGENGPRVGNTLPLEQLHEWTRLFAPPADPARHSSAVNGVYGLVLGASDGFVLRPGYRVREEAKLRSQVSKGIAAYVERHTLVEIDKLMFSNGCEWKPGDWRDCCFICEVALPPGTVAHSRDYLEHLVGLQEQVGLSLIRAFYGTGWANFVLLFKADSMAWRNQSWFLSDDKKRDSVLARTMTAVIASTGVFHRTCELEQEAPWSQVPAKSEFEAQSLIRVRSTTDLYRLSDTEHRPPNAVKVVIRPTLGPYDGIATFTLSTPSELPLVVEWLFAQITAGHLTRSVTAVPMQRDVVPS